MWGTYGNWSWGFGLFHMLGVWILGAILVVVLVRFFNLGTSRKGASVAPESPLDILKRRYAAGEIDSREYEERKRILGV